MSSSLSKTLFKRISFCLQFCPKSAVQMPHSVSSPVCHWWRYSGSMWGVQKTISIIQCLSFPLVKISHFLRFGFVLSCYRIISVFPTSPDFFYHVGRPSKSPSQRSCLFSSPFEMIWGPSHDMKQRCQYLRGNCAGVCRVVVEMDNQLLSNSTNNSIYPFHLFLNPYLDRTYIRSWLHKSLPYSHL